MLLKLIEDFFYCAVTTWWRWDLRCIFCSLCPLWSRAIGYQSSGPLAAGARQLTADRPALSGVYMLNDGRSVFAAVLLWEGQRHTRLM